MAGLDNPAMVSVPTRYEDLLAGWLEELEHGPQQPDN